MANLLNSGASFLNAQRTAHMSESVIYERGGFAPINIQATIGRSETESIDNNGLVVRSKSRDFIVTCTDLVIDGALTVPIRGDLITETDDDGAAHVYTVLSDNGDGVYQFSDDYRNALRIHTKFERTETPPT